MSHDHDHSHSHDNVKSLRVVFFLNFFFTLVEIAGGLFTNSLAILSDALHDLGDTFSLGLAWYLEKLSEKKRTNRFTFGYKRFSLLGAFISALILISGSIFIVINAIPRILHPEPIRPFWMLIFALVGIGVNGLAVLRLRKGKKLNQRVVMLHLLEDVLGWAAVLVGSIFILIFNFVIIDPILSLVISLFILWKTLRHFLRTAQIFLQSTPSHIEIQKIEAEINAIEKVKKAHDIHIWSLDGSAHVASLHLVMENNLSPDEIIGIKQACRIILKEHHVDHVTIETELETESCLQTDC
ncbi:MAG: cation transporter [Spirochaetales bacterium]|nr:cation transporter [Spirochaetales bacterium]